MLVPALKSPWTLLNATYTSDISFIDRTYAALLTAYHEEGKRFYHTITHIQQLLSLQQQYADLIRDNEVVLFSIFFHDIIYDVRQPDNEEKSAEAAVIHLNKIGFPADKTAAVKDFIMATKTHINTTHPTDLDYFLDFDLQILGSDSTTYNAYTQQIRREYSIYPDEIYHPGRKKVLQHFLEMPAIYRTTTFRELYEETARQNIRAEIDTL